MFVMTINNYLVCYFEVILIFLDPLLEEYVIFISYLLSYHIWVFSNITYMVHIWIISYESYHNYYIINISYLFRIEFIWTLWIHILVCHIKIGKASTRLILKIPILQHLDLELWPGKLSNIYIVITQYLN